MGFRSHRTARRGVFLAAVFAMCAGHAAEMPRPGPVVPAPDAFEDWRLVCAETCDIRTAIVGRDGSEVLTVSARRDGGGALRIETPLPLFLPDPVRLTFGPAGSRAIPWRTCGATGCEARAPLAPELLADLRREREGTVVLTLETGERVRFGVSLLGFTAAWRALSEAR